MNSIPMLNGNPLEEINGTFDNKGIMIAENPDSGENNREIKYKSLNDFLALSGRVVGSDRAPTTGDIFDNEGNKYPLLTNWFYKKPDGTIEVYVLKSISEDLQNAFWSQATSKVVKEVDSLPQFKDDMFYVVR